MITIDSVDVSSHLLSARRTSSVCQIGSTLEILLDGSCAASIAPGDTVAYTESSLTFTGWAQSVAYERPQYRIRIVAHDCLPIIDYFFYEDAITEEDQDVAYWINYCLILAGMNSMSIADFGIDVPPELNFRYMNMGDVLFELIGLIGEYFIESDGNYKAKLSRLDSNIVADPRDAIELETYYSDNWIRNEVHVIWGSSGSVISGVSSGSQAGTLLDAHGLVQRIIFASPMVQTQAVAEDLIDRALDFYADPLYVKTAKIVGGAPLSLSQYLVVDEYSGVVTALEQEWQEQWIQNVQLDGRCHSIWDFSPRGIVDVAALVMEIDLKGTPQVATLIVEVDIKGHPRVAQVVLEIDVA